MAILNMFCPVKPASVLLNLQKSRMCLRNNREYWHPYFGMSIMCLLVNLFVNNCGDKQGADIRVE